MWMQACRARRIFSPGFERAFSAAAAKGSPASAQPASPNLQGVKHILAVASGKGGVGKSSVAVNLAYLLSRRPASVGILDADIYGPSLPGLLPREVEDGKVYQSEAGGLIPLTFNGVRLMSMGYMRPGQHVALRGPMVSALAQQMLTQTEWGELDYLIIDMPPGTGDIHLTVSQHARVDAAVVVSTPQALALADVEKGIAMFNQVSIPTAAVVENMSTFMCRCGEETALFDDAGGARRIAEQFGVPKFFQLPLDPSFARSRDPRSLGSDRPIVHRLGELADVIVEQLELSGTRAIRHSLASIDGTRLLELTTVSSSGRVRRTVEARAARLACKSAKMWDEFTGEKLFREEDIPLDVQATKIQPAGAYAVHIDWSDGHKTLMPYKALLELSSEA